MKITTATAKDQDAVIALWSATRLLKPYHFPETEFKTAIDNPSSCIFLASLDGQPVGTVLAGFEGHRGWVYRLAVDPAHQKKNIGDALLKHAENWLAVTFHTPSIMLLVRAENSAILDFYKKRGYDQTDTILMWKDLRGEG